MLHDDRPLFEQIILRTSEANRIDPAIIEKDYYVTIFLNSLTGRIPDIIFKGGTSLSKCFGLIRRFSEDIDLNLMSQKSLAPTERERKQLKEAIEDTANDLRLILSNPEEIGSKKKFNRFVFSYDSLFTSGYLKQNLIVETATAIQSFPIERRNTTSFVLSFLLSERLFDRVDTQLLEQQEINVQSMERTLIDKAFALGDYYLSGNITEHSRHIYDIFKLMDVINLDSNLKKLFEEVRLVRKEQKTCLSAQDNQNLAKLLSEIIGKHIFEQDYNHITKALLFEDVSYDRAIESVNLLISFLNNSQ